MRATRFTPSLLLLLVMLVFTSCEPEEFVPQPEPVPLPSLSKYLLAEGSSTLFAEALIRTGLDLDSVSGRIRLALVPTDAAFADSEVDPEALSLPELTSLVSYHLIARDMAYREGAPDFVDVLGTENTSGPDSTQLSVVLRRKDGTFSANGTRALGVGDVRRQPAGQAIFLNRVLQPPTLHAMLSDLPELSQFRALADGVPAVSRRLTENYSSTLFAPVNTAVGLRQRWIDQLDASGRERLLQTHLLAENVAGDVLYAHPGTTLNPGNVLDLRPTDYSLYIRYFQDPQENRVRIIKGGIQTLNGVLYTVDRVLTPKEL